MAARYDAVLLDFGGTLFSYRYVGRGTMALITEAARRLGVDVEPRTAAVAYRDASRAAFRDFYPRAFYLHRDLFHDTFRRFALEVGGRPTADFLDWFHEEQRKLVVGGFELRPGCAETLRSMREAGAHVSIASNIDDDYLLPMIKRAGLDQLLDAWTSSEEAASCKPDESFFRYVLAKAACPPERALFVGDSAEHDIAGARRVGMSSVLLREEGAQPPGSGAGEPGVPDFEIDELPELLGIVGVEA